MKNSEIRGLSIEELTNKLASEKANFDKLTFAHSITPIENPIKIRETRRFIARLSTELKAKQNAAKAQ